MTEGTGHVDISASTIGVSKALDRVAETTQLDERNVGITMGNGITPPYPPGRLAAMMEVSGTHAVAVKKKAQREVGFGFDIVPHDRADEPERGEGTDHETVQDFWHGRDSIWKIGPKGTPTTSPTEVFEQARQDYHAVGWLAIELLYTADDRLAGLAQLPARTVRVRKDTDDNDRTAGHGFVQKLDARTRYFAEAGDRHRTDVNGNDDSIFVDKETGEVTRDRPENPANELLFIPNPHPNALYYGIPSWVAEIETMVGDFEARRFNREFFEWDAFGQYFIVVEGGTLTKQARAEIREMVTDLREKDGRRVATIDAKDLSSELPGENNAKIRIEPLRQMGDEDQSFTEYRERNEHDIAKVHEIPPILVNVPDPGLGDSSEQQIRDFTKEVIEPNQERFAGRLYRIIHQQILEVDDWTLEFETRGAENEREDAEIAQTRIDSVREAITVREAREMQGLEPQPEWMGDEVANSFLSELGGQPGPGDALEMALAESEAEAAHHARTEARIQTGAATGD